jgi:hypothetical protein
VRGSTDESRDPQIKRSASGNVGAVYRAAVGSEPQVKESYDSIESGAALSAHSTRDGDSECCQPLLATSAGGWDCTGPKGPFSIIDSSLMYHSLK